MDKHCLFIMKSSKYFKYLENIGIETNTIRSAILSEFKKGTFNNFINSHEQKLSPNIYIENLVFTEVFKYLNEHYADSFVFEDNVKLDIKSIVAHSKSLIQRPSLLTPSESNIGFKEPDSFNGFIRIARFEQQLAEREYNTDASKQGAVLFEGLLPIRVQTNPLYCQYTSDDIWNNTFCLDEAVIQGLYPNLHSIEAPNIMWLNSGLLHMLGLTLDTYKHGLRALDGNQEPILIYRQWREELIGNGASFVGIDANIAKLEGCDLILREDYYIKLKDIIPNMVFYTFKL